MFDVLKSFFSFFFNVKKETLENNLDKDEDEILRKINDFEENDNYNFVESQDNNVVLGHRDPEKFDSTIFKLTSKTGKITFISNEGGLIDNITYFDLNVVSCGLSLKVGDEVVYSVYKARENESERVYKIHTLKNDSWEPSFNPEINCTGEAADEIEAISRIINGRVIKRKGRDIFVEPTNIWCNLDKINVTFVPVEGDWVSLEATVSVNEDVVGLTGDILEIQTIKPLLDKKGFGRITFWCDAKKQGAIENQIFFSELCCEGGYLPNLGDEVAYDAIESDQEKYKWRALHVIPNEVKIRKDNPYIEKDGKNLFFDKNNISIKPSKCILEIELNQIKETTLEIVNTGLEDHVLKNIKMNFRGSKSQLRLKCPKLNEEILIPKEKTITVTFECCGKFLGLSQEMCTFSFRNFKIGKIFLINVMSNSEMNKFLECKSDTFCHVSTATKVYSRTNINTETSLYGRKPWQPPKFISGERKGFYSIPDKLWTAAVGNEEYGKRHGQAVKDLEEYAPYLKDDLNMSQYTDRFHTLLYLEEIEVRNNFRKFDQKSVFLERKGEFFVLNVPNLMEQRPSPIIGDKIVLTQPWSEKNNIQQVGYIHEIEKDKVFVMFHEWFHQNYDESECDVIFEPTMGAIQKAHDAVNRAVKKLGSKWLFPTAVNEKPSQVDFEIEDDLAGDLKELDMLSVDLKLYESQIDENGFVISPKVNSSKKKLNWFNKILNERQKMAVVNILKGHGRPLPYIVFGPPGTGKTSTLVEAALQIHRLVPGSRLLVTTPSNSSADLICERLIQMGNYKPGQLVRLMAFNRAIDGKIPPKLLPYCTLADIRDDSTKELNQIANKANVSTSTLKRLVGRPGIIVGTCACIGSLHYMGFPTGHFTHILVDEAGQATEPDVLISCTFQNISDGQVVLVGDPQQLGPVCFSKLASKYGLGISLMQRLSCIFPYEKDFQSFSETSGYDPRFITKLQINYRSVPEILNLPSQLFYNSDLIPTVSDSEGMEADIIKKFNFKIEGREKPAAFIFHGVVGQNYQESDSPSWFNPHEIWQAVTYLRKCYEIGLTSGDVGIVTPYAKQVQKLRFLINALNLSVPKIGTVEDFQGQERYVIIVSTVRSSLKLVPTDIIHSLGFVACPRRLNVALTRARAVVIILGNVVLLSRDPYWKSVVEYCQKNNSYTGCNLIQFLNDGEQE